MGFSLWLVPAPQECERLKRVMHVHPSESKSPSSYPPIDPHITLGSFPSSIDPSILRESIPKDQSKIPVAFQSVDVGDTYFRSVYIAIQPSSQLSALHANIHKSLNVEPRTPRFPHMSVYYIDDSEPEERHRIREELSSLGVIKQEGEGSVVLDCGMEERLCGVDCSEIWIVKCDGPVPAWQVLEKVPLAS